MPESRPPIAVVGLSALLPGSRDSHGFWRDVLAGRDLKAVIHMGAISDTTETDGDALYNNECDIGPTDTGSASGLPTTDDAVQFEDLIQAGFRVALKSGNVLTGGKSLSMDFRPEIPDTRLTGVELPYPEVPTIPSAFTEVQARLTAFALKVSELPVDSVVTNLNGLITDFRELVANPETQELPGTINETLVAFSEAAAGFTNLVSEFEGKGDEVTAGIEETFELGEFRSLRGDVWRQFRRHKGALAGMVILIIITFGCLRTNWFHIISPSAPSP